MERNICFALLKINLLNPRDVKGELSGYSLLQSDKKDFGLENHFSSALRNSNGD